MKRILLFGLGFCMATGFAQNIDLETKKINYQPKTSPLDVIQNQPIKSSSSKAAAAGTSIGKGPNGYSIGFNSLTPLSTIESLNTIAFLHRSDYLTNSDNSSGSLRIDLSTDGGTTWNNNTGPAWNPNIAASTYPGPARYPSAVLFNPENETSGSKAEIALWATTSLGTNSWFGGQLHGSYKMDNSSTKLAVDSSSIETGMFVISRAVTKIDESTIYGVQLDQDYNLSTYNDTAIMFKGVWNSTTKELDYTKTYESLPLRIDSVTGDVRRSDFKVAFDQTGQIGYITLLGYSPTYPNYGSYHPMVMKTTDGGTNWSAPQDINLDAIMETTQNQTLLSILAARDSGTTQVNNLTTGFETSIIVDKNGDPHIFLNVSICGLTAVFSDGSSGNAFSFYFAWNNLVDIYSEDGGTTYKSRIVATPEAFRGAFGINGEGSEDNRPQVSTNSDRSKIFYSWFDTDTQLWGTSDNDFPDFWVNMYDLNTNSFPFTAENMTTDISLFGTSISGNIAPEAWTNTNGTNTIHCVTQQLDINTNDFLDPVQYTYIPGVFPSTSNISISENEIPTHFNIGQNHPNPALDETSFDINATKSAEYKLTLTNILGQVVLERNLGTLESGKNEITINTSQLNSGVYFYSLFSEGKVFTRKMTVE